MINRVTEPGIVVGNLSRGVVSSLDAKFHPPARRLVGIFPHIAQGHVGSQFIDPLGCHLAAPKMIFWEIEVERIAEIEIRPVMPPPDLRGCSHRLIKVAGFRIVSYRRLLSQYRQYEEQKHNWH